MKLRGLVFGALLVGGASWLLAERTSAADRAALAGSGLAPVAHVAPDVATAPAPAPVRPELPPYEGNDAAARRALAREVEAAIGAGRWARADWGILVTSLDHGDTLYARDPDRALSPASNLKVLTSVVALHHLGPDYRFRTWLASDAPVVDGVLEGDAVLYGTGDPGIGDRYWPDRAAPWEELADQLRAAGIHTIRGRILGDGSFFTGPLVRDDAWEAEDLNEWFGAASGALAYNENVASLRIEPAAPGLAPLVHSVPDHTGQAIVNDGRTVAGRPSSRISFLRDAPTDPIVVAGEIRQGTPDVWRQMTISDPALFAAHGLTHVLRAEGIAVEHDPASIPTPAGSPFGTRRVWGPDSGWRILGELRSPPMGDYLTAVNQRSHNLYADLLLRTLGRELEGQGSFAAGGRVLERFVTDVLGLPADEVRVLDGSGLAADNRLSPRALVALIDFAERAPWSVTFAESLPVAGSRSLRRMTRSAAAGNLRAKTGTISRVSALTGVVRARNGERLAFAIVGNGLPSEQGAKRLVEDRLGEYLAGWSRGDS